MKFGKAVARSWNVASLAKTQSPFALPFEGAFRRGSVETSVLPDTKNKINISPVQAVQQTSLPNTELSQSDARDLLSKLREEALSNYTLDCLGTISVKKVTNNQIERMGSFTSSPVKASGDTQDADVKFSKESTVDELLSICREHTDHLPPAINRKFTKYSSQHTSQINSKSLDNEDNKIRLLQWNHLSQTLGTKNDHFVVCPPEALDWTSRRWRLLEEMVRYQPDIICLQEVDHFDFVSRGLGCLGYTGRFIPKPDSPCIYLQANNGPDGCAIFVKDSKFKILTESDRILEVWRVQSNQVAVCLELEERSSGKEMVVATTHLKARQGALLSTLRNEQGKDLLDWLQVKAGSRPLLLSGDFNAPESEPVYNSICDHSLGLSSAYRFNELDCEAYTTWKIRETGEQKYILDYIFYSNNNLTPVGVLEMPTEDEVGEARFPNLAFPSDHLSLVADFQFND